MKNTKIGENDWQENKSMGDSEQRHNKIHPEEEDLDQLSVSPIQTHDAGQICQRNSLNMCNKDHNFRFFMSYLYVFLISVFD